MNDRLNYHWSAGLLLASPSGEFPVGPFFMHIAYLDESGTHKEARHFVVAGLVAFERNIYFLSRDLDTIQAKYFPSYQGKVFFHASTLHAPAERVEEPFNQLSQVERDRIASEVYQVIAESHVRIIAVAIEKKAIDGDPYERGFEQVVSRFDRMLGRILRDNDENQRGLIVVAESSYRENLELLANKIATEGHRWGNIHNLADIPYFVPAKSTRLLQLADFVSNAVYSKYESGHSKYFDQISRRFDQEPGRIHGLVHITRDRDTCYCPACLQHRNNPIQDP